ncbi:MAG: pyrrolo-quinoline quinone, partial [Candidatus Hydrogenedentes bacterium]|nr:pyrrolo-quinoline quinone [Candidatus Hydrogenedentota bacterium]
MKLCLENVWPLVVIGFAAAYCCLGETWAEDQPQWGERHSRNMVSTEADLPTTFDPETGENVKWSAPLGSNAYGSPVISAGNVLVGANNSIP